jgi:methionyl-tRNA synthetase
MVDRFLGGELPARPRDDSPVAGLVSGLADDVAARFDVYELTGALERIWEVVRGLNRLVESRAPWQLAKDGKQDELEQTLYDLVDGIRVVAIALASYVPETAPRILSSIGADADEIAWGEVEYGRTPARSGIVPAAPLFPRIDAPTTAA